MAENIYTGIYGGSGEYGKLRRANAGVLDDPFKFAEDVVEGVGHGIIKTAHDTFVTPYNATAWAINSTGWNPVESILPDFGVTLEDEPIPYADNYWNALESVGVENDSISPTQKGFAEMTSLLTSTRAAAARLSQIPKFKTLLESGSKWDKLKHALYVGTLSGAAADMIHTKGDDKSIFELFQHLAPDSGIFKTEAMQWWMDKEDDSEFTGRLKNAVEGSMIGIAADSFFSTLGYLFKSSKEAAHASATTPQELAEAADKFFGSGNNNVVEDMLRERSVVGQTMGDEILSGADDIDLSGIAEEVSWKQVRNAQKSGRGLDYRARKGRAAKKLAKKLGTESFTDRSLDELYVPRTIDQDLADSGMYADVPAPTAAAARREIDGYNPQQILEGQPMNDVFLSNVDASQMAKAKEGVELVVATNKQAEQLLSARILDPKSTPEQIKIAKNMLNDYFDSTDYRLNPHRSGDMGVKEGLDIARSLNLSMNRPPALKKQTLAQLVIDTIAKQSTGENFIRNVNFADSHGLDVNAHIKTLTNLQVLGYDTEKYMVQVAADRHTLVKRLAEGAKKFEGKTLDMSDPKVLKVIEDFIALDSLDHGLQGTRGIQARLLGNNRINSGSYSELLDWVSDTAAAKAAVDGTEEVSKKEALRKLNMKMIIEMMESKDTAEVSKFFAKISKADLTKANNIEEALQPKTIMDWIQSWFYGNMLARTGTVIGSVGIGGAVSTTWKQIVEPAFSAAINIPGRIGILTDSGHRFRQSIIGAEVMAKQTLNMVANLFSKGTSKPLADMMNIGGMSVREGAENASLTFKELGPELKETAEWYAKQDMYWSKSMVSLITPLAKRSMAVNNVFVRGIQHTDNFFKGLNNESTMLQEASRIWYKEGGHRGLIPNVTKDAFTADYMDVMRKVVNIQKGDLTATQRSNALTDLFEGKGAAFQSQISESLGYAKRLGEEATLQQSTHGTALGSVIKGLESSVKNRPLARLGLMMLLPFRKTPINLLSEVIDMSPVAPIFSGRWQKAFKSGTPEEKIRVLAKMAAGTTLIATLANLVETGRITGRIRPEDRDRMARMGRKEHSILIGGEDGEATWWNYSKAGALASLISSVAEYQQMSMEDPDASIMLLLSASFSIAADDTHMTTYRDIIDAAQSDNPIKDVSRLVFNRATMQVTPSSGVFTTLEDMTAAVTGEDVKKYRSTTDKEVGGVLAELNHQFANSTRNHVAWRVGMDGAGFGSYETDLTVTGDDMYKNSQSGAGRWLALLGIGSQDAKNDPLSMELENQRLLPSNSSQASAYGVKMTANEHKNMWKDMMYGGTNGYSELTDLVMSRDYKQGLLGPRRAVLSEALTLHKEFVKSAFVDKSPRLKREIYKKKLHELLHEKKFIEADYESLDYYMDGRTKAWESDSSNAHAVTKGLEELGIEIPEEIPNAIK